MRLTLAASVWTGPDAGHSVHHRDAGIACLGPPGALWGLELEFFVCHSGQRNRCLFWLADLGRVLARKELSFLSGSGPPFHVMGGGAADWARRLVGPGPVRSRHAMESVSGD